MTIKLADLEASTQEKIEKDSEFQSSLENLTDEEKTAKVSERKSAEIDAELEKMSKGAQNYESQKIRAEKAEQEAKELKDKLGVKPTEEVKGLPPKDYLALTEAKITSEDFDEVMNWAGYRKVSLSDALKDKTLQTILRERAEQRATDEATAVKGRRPADTEPQGQELLRRAHNEQLPETDKGIEELVQAEHKAKLAKIKK